MRTPTGPAICETEGSVEQIVDATRAIFGAPSADCEGGGHAVTKHAAQMSFHGGPGEALCKTSHYAAIVDAQKDVEIYQLGDVDCPSCLRRMADKHQEIAEVFRGRLRAQPVRCRIYDTACINPTYCDEKDACCAGDMNCAPATVRALCHECSEMVDVVDGKLDPHHGTTGDGCPQNGAPARICLHPRVSDRIAELETALAFAPRRGGTR
jgi:hypothetical protein